MIQQPITEQKTQWLYSLAELHRTGKALFDPALLFPLLVYRAVLAEGDSHDFAELVELLKGYVERMAKRKGIEL